MPQKKLRAGKKSKVSKQVFWLGKAGNIDPKALHDAVVAVKKEREEKAKLAKARA